MSLGRPVVARDRAAALVRARRIATGVLLGLVAVFLATLAVDEPPTLVRLVRAMAEAGMVGGLADWFAVEALFRRPLGLPIPHTALLPANQARAARNVGRFFEAHFLDPAELEARIRAMAPARHAAAWLSDRANAMTVARQLTGLLGGVIRHDPSPRALARARAWLRGELMAAGADAALAEGTAGLLKRGIRSHALGEILALARRKVDENRETATQLVQDRSRWWIASTIDRRVAALAVDGVLSLLDELCTEGSELRRGFEAAFDDAVDALEREGTLARSIGEGRRALARSGAFDRLALDFAATLRDRLAARLDSDPDAVAAPVAALLGDRAARLAADPAARDALDAHVAALSAQLIGEMRPLLGGYVADVIAGWQPEEMIDRFEAELGPDLQFIRVNGAVLGAMIGGVLFAISAVFG
ncbi:MAG TPA: DUF445 domain-containing protein [Amaricoccus sp.]|nr:DUF445 domain-containing protein [Amaricoccus sp.]